MNFLNIFAYINLAIAIISAVTTVLHLAITPTTPLTGLQLVAIAQPILSDIQVLIPKANIPAALVVDIADAIADAVNAFYHPKPVS